MNEKSLENLQSIEDWIYNAMDNNLTNSEVLELCSDMVHHVAHLRFDMVKYFTLKAKGVYNGIK